MVEFPDVLYGTVWIEGRDQFIKEWKKGELFPIPPDEFNFLPGTSVIFTAYGDCVMDAEKLILH